MSVFEITPAELGVERVRRTDLAGGTPEENAELMRRIFNGEAGPLAEVTVVNAGAAIYVGGGSTHLAEGVRRARETLASGAARHKLEELQNLGSRG